MRVAGRVKNRIARTNFVANTIGADRTAPTKNVKRLPLREMFVIRTRRLAGPERFNREIEWVSARSDGRIGYGTQGDGELFEF